MMVRLVTEDWAARLQARLREEATAMRSEADDGAEPGNKNDNGLCFGPYGTSPVSGLHFEAAEDTAAS